MVADVVTVCGSGKVIPVGGEHRQQLAGLVLGEVQEADVCFEFVQSGWEALAVDRPSTARRTDDEPLAPTFWLPQ